MEQKELNKILNSLDTEAYQMIRSWLFDKANEFAPDDKAWRLHSVCNELIPIIEELEPTYFKG